jgi:deoxyribodipyrimidine photo-lyase
VSLGQRQGRQRAGQAAPHHDEIEIHAGGNDGAARAVTGEIGAHFVERAIRLNDLGPGPGRYVLYWMQQSQRSRCNHALQFAVARADALGLPLLVGFGLTDYPEANLRSYRFMLDGLRETAAALADRGIGFVLRRGAPDQVALALGADAAAIVCDRGYLRHQRRWRRQVADQAACQVIEVEADAVVPVGAASDKAEFAARTLRPRIHRLLDRFLRPLPERAPRHGFTGRPRGLDVGDPAALLRTLELDASVPAVPLAAGTGAALARLRGFLRHGLPGYARGRALADDWSGSRLSPYLHFGQISPLEVALAVRASGAPAADRAAYLEQLIVRRELAQNFCWYTEDYDRFDSVPAWAQATLHTHESDARGQRYSEDELEQARTHDSAWNTAMREMRDTGLLANRLRMYWGKKLLEWIPDPAAAHRLALRLNNRDFLDGRDPSSYANVAWIFGLHDRPFAERPLFGKVRSMTAAGLERKIDLPAYQAAAQRRIHAATGDQGAKLRGRSQRDR